jgi:predicted transcriptional regulator
MAKNFTTNNLLLKTSFDLDITQKELAEIIGMKRTWLSSVSRQRYEVKFSHMERIFESLGYKIELKLTKI